MFRAVSARYVTALTEQGIAGRQSVVLFFFDIFAQVKYVLTDALPNYNS